MEACFQKKINENLTSLSSFVVAAALFPLQKNSQIETQVGVVTGAVRHLLFTVFSLWKNF